MMSRRRLYRVAWLLFPLMFGLNIILVISLFSKTDPKTLDSREDVLVLDSNPGQEVRNSVRKGQGHLASSSMKYVRGDAVLVQQRHIEELDSRVVPNQVHYVWCGNRTFEFRHFLSVLSVWYSLEPDLIELKFEHFPIEDKYNTWLTYLRRHIPAFSVSPLPPHVRGDDCGAPFGIDSIMDRGGVYLDNDVILGSSAMSLLRKNISLAVSPSDHHISLIGGTIDNNVLRKLRSKFLLDDKDVFSGLSSLNQTQEMYMLTCSTVNKLSDFTRAFSNLTTHDSEHLEGKQDLTCAKLSSTIYPHDILEGRATPLKTFLNILMYGELSPVSQGHNVTRDEMKSDSNTKSARTSIPHIVHYIWFGQKKMDFSMYLSFLSVVRLVQPRAIFIHTDLRLHGRYWNLTRTHPLVHLVYMEPPTTIYGHAVLYAQHRSDVVRANVLDKYGGIYLDWDVFWLKPPTDLLTSGHEAILSFDHMPRPHFPETINMGVVLAMPRSEFIRAWRAALVNYKSRDFLYNAVELPYKIYEKYPQSVFLHDGLQVMCYYLKCHPIFHPDHKHWGRGQPFDWKTDVYAIHFTHPNPPAFSSESTLRAANGTFAEIGRFIWGQGR